MNDSRLTFSSSINISLPVGAYDILYVDAYHFGFTKGGKPNISGFVNTLIPELSHYQDVLHDKILKYNNGDESITRTVEQCIFNVYLAQFDFRNDALINVPLRINNNKLSDFLFIHDIKLDHYNISLRNFLRKMIFEYTLKPLDQREYLFCYSLVKNLNAAIEERFECSFYTSYGEKYIFVPVSLDISPSTRRNYIIGCTGNKKEIVILPLSIVRTLIVSTSSFDITEIDLSAVYDAFEQFLSNEKVSEGIANE